MLQYTTFDVLFQPFTRLQPRRFLQPCACRFPALFPVALLGKPHRGRVYTVKNKRLCQYAPSHFFHTLTTKNHSKHQ